MKNTMLCVIAPLFFLASCTNTQLTEKAESFEVVSPMIADTTYTNEYVAEIIALQNVEVRTRQKGFIETIHIDEGRHVSKGQLLFTMSSRVIQQELAKTRAACQSASAELKSSEIELANTRKLLDKNVIAETEYLLANAKVESLKAKLEEAKSDEAQASLRLSFTEIRAPFDGVINRIPNKAGSLVEEGELLTTISDNKEVLAYFHLSEKEYLDYVTSDDEDKAKSAELLLANGEKFDHKGVIETSESEFDQTTGNIAFRVKFPNPDGILKHGSNGKIVIRKKLKDVILIPQKSTFEIQDKLFVYVLKSDSTVEQRNIEPKLRLPHLFVVETGLAANEHILYEGTESVTAGMKILPVHINELN